MRSYNSIYATPTATITTTAATTTTLEDHQYKTGNKKESGTESESGSESGSEKTEDDFKSVGIDGEEERSSGRGSEVNRHFINYFGHL